MIISPQDMTRDAGLRNLDQLVMDPQKIIDMLLSEYEILDCGTEMLVFRSLTRPDLVLLISQFNIIGSDWTKRLINNLLPSIKDKRVSRMLKETSEILSSPNQKEQVEKKKTHFTTRILDRVAAHNIQYGVDPSSTYPINTILCVRTNGDIKPVGAFMKYIEGDIAQDVTYPEYQITHDSNPANVIIGSSGRRYIIDLDLSSVLEISSQ